MSPFSSRTRRAMAVALVAVAVPGGPALAAEADAFLQKKPYRLTLLHNNDAESKLVTGDSVSGYGGSARFKTVLNRLRAEERGDTDAAIRGGAKRRGSLLVSAGDNFLAGLNLSASFKKGVPWYDSLAFRSFGYDAATIGNHEFDFGPDGLADFISGTGRTPFLSANLDVTPEPRLRRLVYQGKIRRSTIVAKGGDLIGVIGLTTPDIRSIASPGRVRISDEVANAANREARILQLLGINKIILSSHLQGLASEEALIPKLRGIDIVIAGGGDELLANAGDRLLPGQGTPVGPYPKLVTDASGNAVPIVTTQGELRYVGRLTVEFDRGGKITKIDAGKSGPVRVSGTGTDPDVADRDPELAEQVEQPLIDYRAEVDANVIATTEVRLDGRNPDPIRRREANLGNLVADSYLHAANTRAAATGSPRADVALANGGGIRNSSVLPIGPLSEGDTFDILPFDNLVVVVPGVPRTQFKELLENAYAITPSTSGAGRFGHIGGLRVEVDTSRQAQVTQAGGTVTTPGERVRSATLADGTPVIVNGEVVPGAGVNVATVDFLAKGGDVYPFRGLPFVSTTVPYQQALATYLTAPVANGGLGGVVRASQYPEGGEGRISISPLLPPGPALP